MTRIPALLTSALATALLAAFMIVSAVLAVAAHPAAISLGIGAVLLLWGAFLAWAAWGLAHERPWSRGPVVAAGLLHATSFAAFVPSQPLALLPAAVGLLAAGAAVVPSATRALGRRFDGPDAAASD